MIITIKISDKISQCILQQQGSSLKQDALLETFTIITGSLDISEVECTCNTMTLLTGQEQELEQELRLVALKPEELNP